MSKVLAWLDGKKTYTVCLAALVYALSGWWGGFLDGKTAADIVLFALGAGGFRSAMKQ